MRHVLAVGLYLTYIRTFCDYLLTGKFDLVPTDPAGLLAHASQLDQVLARPDGVLLCALFAVGCYGLASGLQTFADQTEKWIFSPKIPCHTTLPPDMSGRFSAPLPTKYDSKLVPEARKSSE